jgi:hypothetical protein
VKGSNREFRTVRSVGFSHWGKVGREGSDTVSYRVTNSRVNDAVSKMLFLPLLLIPLTVASSGLISSSPPREPQMAQSVDASFTPEEKTQRKLADAVLFM